MDRNQLIGLTLISVMLITYTQFFAPQLPTKPTTIQGAPTANSPTSSQEEAPQVATPVAIDSAQYGAFAPAMQGTEKEVVLENEVMKVTLSSRGGTVKEVTLKKYQDHQKQPLTLLDGHSSHMGFQLSTQGKQFNTSDLFFTTAVHNPVGKEDHQVAFTLTVGPDQYIRHIFTLPGKGYTLSHAWEMVGLKEVLDSTPVQFVWHDRIKRVEKDVNASRKKTTINYYGADGKFAHLKEQSDKQQERLLQDPIQWLSIKQRFFTTGIIAQQAFVNGHVATTPTPQSATTVKEAQVSLTLPDSDKGQNPQGQFTFYFGPNDYQVLKHVTKGFSKNIYLGWPVVRWINQLLIIPVFAFLEQYISNYGIIIILLVILIKSLLLPLSYSSYLAMAKMRVLKPALDVLKAKHGQDMQKIQMEQMALYREMGINPLSGCIPVLLQMPILLAMFNFFPNAIALRQQSFLWASDLSTYDAVLNLPFRIPVYGSHVSLFALLMTASTILYTWSNNQLTSVQEGPMKAMTYIMPFTFLLILNSFPAGLSFYYFVSNLTTFGQQGLIKQFVDEEKVKKKLEENKHKNKDKKKSRLQQGLEAAMRVERGNKAKR